MEEAILTATIAFIAAMVAQWVSHRFSIKGENIKFNKEVVQELILPNINSILLYLDTETAFRKGHDVEIEIIPDDIVENIFKNSSIANSKIINALYNYRKSVSYFDGRGEAKHLSIFKVFFVFLDYALLTLKKSGFNDEYLIETVKKKLKLCGVLYLLTDLIGKEDTTTLLSYKWTWNPKVYDKLPLDTLRTIIEFNRGNLTAIGHERMIILNILVVAFEESEMNDSEFIKGIIKEARETAERWWDN